MSPYAHMRLWLSTAFLQWSFSQYLFPSILNTWLQFSPFSWTTYFASKQNWVRAVNIQSMKFDRKEFEYSQTISKPKWLLLVLKTIQLITVMSLKTYLLILVLLFLLYSVLDLCQELAEPIVCQFILQNPVRKAGTPSPFYRWENSGSTMLVIYLNSVSSAWLHSLSF